MKEHDYNPQVQNSQPGWTDTQLDLCGTTSSHAPFASFLY